MARSLPLLPLVLGLVVGVLLELPSVLGQLRDGDDSSNVTTWLPRDLRPQHYRVRIQPILEEGNFTAPAELEFTFFARRATNRVVLNVRHLEISESSVTVEEESIPHTWTPLPVTGHEYDADLETYAVVLGTGLRPGRIPVRYRLRMRYVAPVSDGAAGLYRVSYADQNNNRRWMAMTQLHPTNARTMFPCLDEPQYKAPFTLSVARRREYTSVANAPLLSSEPIDDNWVWDHFETSVPMSSYLIALAVFDFDKIESRYNATAADGGELPADGRVHDADVTFRVWSRASQLPLGAYAAHIGPRVLRYYADIFNIPFPLPKQDMVATPKLTFQAMENWGLIFFRENGLLVNEADSGSRHFVAKTVAHELAHQWFGNLVTMRWWNDVWLNEGFATYLSQLGVQQVEPQWRSEGVFVLESMQAVMQKDALPSSHPVSREVHRVSDIDHIFDEISYQKGSSVVRMMSEFLGAGAFQRGLNAYLRRHAYGNAAQDDLWAALTEASNAGGPAANGSCAHGRHGGLPPGQSVKGIMDSWTLRTGFPVIRVQRDYSRGTAGVTQQRFLVGPAPAPQAEADCCWGVPLWVKTSNGKTSSEALHWLRGPRTTLRGLPVHDGAQGHWLLVNGARAGYYRVNYDYPNWRLLTQAVAGRRLADLESAGLVDDALALAGAGHLGYDVALGLLRHLPRDQPSLAWVAGLPWLSKLSHLLHSQQEQGAWPQGHPHPHPHPFARWARALAEDLLRVSNGPSLHQSNDPVDHAFVTRVRRWACGLGVPGCLGNASAVAARRANETDICRALMEVADWDAFLYKCIEDDPALYLKLAECVQSPEAIKRIVVLAMENNYKEEEHLFRNLAANPFAFDTLMGFLKENWMQLQDRYGPSFNYAALKAIAPYAKSHDHLVQIKKMSETSKNINLPINLQDEGNHNVWWLQTQAERLIHTVQELQ